MCRQEHLDKLSKQFAVDVHALQEWMTGRQSAIAGEQKATDLHSAQLAVARVDAHDQEYEKKREQVSAIESLVKQLSEGNYHLSSQVGGQLAEMQSQWTALGESGKKWRGDAVATLEIEQKKEDLRVDFAASAKDFEQLSRETVDRSHDHLFGDSLETVQATTAQSPSH